eukprot:scaffold33603_cov75-Phaeocystis_antarctica.AAC.2
MRKCLNAAAAYMLRWTAQSSQSMLEGQSSAAAEQSGGRAGTQCSEKLGPGIWPGLTSRSSPGPVLTSSPAREAALALIRANAIPRLETLQPPTLYGKFEPRRSSLT